MSHSTICIILMAAIVSAAGSVTAGPKAILRDAPEVKLPSPVDCNSPSFWVGDTFYVLTSTNQGPRRMKGSDQFHLGEPEEIKFDNKVDGWRWIECVWQADDGVLYGFYHHEFYVCPGTYLTAPEIGAAKSTDNGLNWTDLGTVVKARPNTIDCKSTNIFFAGGNGDFSVMLDKKKQYLYLYYTTYAGELSEMGVAVARMSWKDRDNPVGKFHKYYKGKWEEAGLGGLVTPIFPSNSTWMKKSVDGFWGPGIHWNTYLKQYVILMNRAVGEPKWPQEGVYISYSGSLSDPSKWTKPERIHEGGRWYPGVIGLTAKDKPTDKLCAKQARFYMRGGSNDEIVFFKDGEDTTK